MRQHRLEMNQCALDASNDESPDRSYMLSRIVPSALILNAFVRAYFYVNIMKANSHQVLCDCSAFTLLS